jgi:ferritin
MISNKLEKELNSQLNEELYSAYLYLSMSAYLATKNLSGFSHWMKVQFEEEQAHAMKLFSYIIDRGGKVELQEIRSPQKEWDGILGVFDNIVKHEAYITSRINNLVDIALAEKDHATVSIMQWYVTEQVEEEATVGDVYDQLKLIEGKGPGLFMLDREARQRTFVPIDTNANN